MPVIKLQSSDGEIFEVEVDIAKASNTIKTMIEGKTVHRTGYAVHCWLRGFNYLFSVSFVSFQIWVWMRMMTTLFLSPMSMELS